MLIKQKVDSQDSTEEILNEEKLDEAENDKILIVRLVFNNFNLNKS
jgi:hypothetical protein